MDYFSRALAGAIQLIFSFDPTVYQIAWTSLWISLSAAFIAALLAVPLGVVFALREFTGKRLLQHALNTLMALPTVVVGLLLYGVLSRRGPLGELGLLYTPAAVVVGECLLIFPIIMNLTIAAICSADKRLLPTLQALGANQSQQIFLLLSEMRLAVLAAVIAGFGRAIGEVGVAMMLGGNIQGFTRTMTTAIALEASKGEFEQGLALGTLLLTIAFAIYAILSLLRGTDE